jgi:hypothetical protein
MTTQSNKKSTLEPCGNKSSTKNPKPGALVRLVKRIFGPNVNGQAVATVIATIPFMALTITLAIIFTAGYPITVWTLLTTGYLFASTLFVIPTGQLARQRTSIGLFRLFLGVGWFVVIYLIKFANNPIRDLMLGASAMLGAVIVVSLYDAIYRK